MVDVLAILQSLVYGKITKLSLLFVHDAARKIGVPNIIFNKNLVLLDWPGSLALI